MTLRNIIEFYEVVDSLSEHNFKISHHRRFKNFVK
jgi:hypothetical protein